MKFSRNGKFILLIITAFFFSFVSCSAKNDDKNCTIRFSWWGKKARTEYTLQGISMFESLNPTIKVQPEYDSWSNYESSIENALETGTCADVMQINFDWLYKYFANENIFMTSMSFLIISSCIILPLMIWLTELSTASSMRFQLPLTQPSPFMTKKFWMKIPCQFLQPGTNCFRLQKSSKRRICMSSL